MTIHKVIVAAQFEVTVDAESLGDAEERANSESELVFDSEIIRKMVWCREEGGRPTTGRLTKSQMRLQAEEGGKVFGVIGVPLKSLVGMGEEVFKEELSNRLTGSPFCDEVQYEPLALQEISGEVYLVCTVRCRPLEEDLQ